MDKTERQRTTEFAAKKIKRFLDTEEYISALLLASIYANIRLRTLLTSRLDPPKEKWEYASNAFDSLLGFNKLLNLCDELGLLHGQSPKKLKDLWEKRCKIAHESELWKELSDKDKKEITQLCECTIKFLNETNS
jgi:hypothetical protein